MKSADRATRRAILRAEEMAARCEYRAEQCRVDNLKICSETERLQLVENERREAAQHRREADELHSGKRAIVMVTRRQSSLVHKIFGVAEKLHYAICTTGALTFRPAQMKRWREVFDCMRIMAPSYATSIESLWTKMEVRIFRVTGKEWSQ